MLSWLSLVKEISLAVVISAQAFYIFTSLSSMCELKQPLDFFPIDLNYCRYQRYLRFQKLLEILQNETICPLLVLHGYLKVNLDHFLCLVEVLLAWLHIALTVFIVDDVSKEIQLREQLPIWGFQSVLEIFEKGHDKFFLIDSLSQSLRGIICVIKELHTFLLYFMSPCHLILRLSKSFLNLLSHSIDVP